MQKRQLEKLFKKYRQQRAAKMTLGFSKKRDQREDGGLMTFERKENNRLPADCKQKVKAFLIDDISPMTKGRKQTVIQKKFKKQKRLLTDMMKNLQQKFLSETEDQVFYSCKDCVNSTHSLLRPPSNTEIALTQWSLEENGK